MAETTRLSATIGLELEVDYEIAAGFSKLPTSLKELQVEDDYKMPRSTSLKLASPYNYNSANKWQGDHNLQPSCVQIPPTTKRRLLLFKQEQRRSGPNKKEGWMRSKEQKLTLPPHAQAAPL